MATTPAPTATGPVTRRTFRASRRTLAPAAVRDVVVLDHAVARVVGLVELVAGQPVGDAW